MPMIGGNDQTVWQLMQLINQINERKREQGAALLNTLQPGQAVASLPGGERAYRRVTGAKAMPGQVLRPQTIENLTNTERVSAWQGMPDPLRRAAADNMNLNQATSTTGVKTQEQYEAQRGEVTTAARAQQLTTEAGAERLAARPRAELGAVGERRILGETPTEAKVGERLVEVKGEQAETASQYNKYAQDFLADPANTVWGKMLSEAGLDPKGVTQAFATGQDAVLGGFMTLRAQTASSRATIEEEIQKARIRAAEKLQGDTGGALPIRSTLAIENSIESGESPFESSGVPAQQVHMYMKARELQYSGYLRTAVANNNPQAKLLEKYLENMKNFPNTDQMNAANTSAAMLAATIMTEGDLGPRPGPEQPEQQAAWDKQAQYHYHTLGIIGKDVKWWILKDKTGLQQTPPFMTPEPIDTSAAGGKGAKRQAADGSATGPAFVDRSAGAAVRGILNQGNDTTFRRGGSGTGPGVGGAGTFGAGADSAGVAGANDQRQTPPSINIRKATVADYARQINPLGPRDYEGALTAAETIRGKPFRDAVEAEVERLNENEE